MADSGGTVDKGGGAAPRLDFSKRDLAGRKIVLPSGAGSDEPLRGSDGWDVLVHRSEAAPAP